MEDGGPRMTLYAHLEELRRRLVRSLFAVGAAFGICFYFHERVFRFLRKPLQRIIDGWPERKRELVEIIQTEPGQAFTTTMKVAFFAGVVVAAPILLHQAWAFVAAGLYAHERRAVKYYALPGFLLFLGGVALAYYLVIPWGLDFLLSWGLEGGMVGKTLITIDSYISLVAWSMFLFGLAFQIPVVMVFLMRLGVVAPATFRRWRKAVIVANFVLGMILTPPDVISQLVMAGTLTLLYEAAIAIGGFVATERRKENG
jgi:sec-independent protein translocase protein TatC